MNSRQRVLSAFERRGYDRIPVKREGTPEVNQMLREYFGLSNAIQVGSPLESTLTMYHAAGSLAETIDESILSLGL